MRVSPARLEQVAGLIDVGKVRVEIAATFPLDRVRDAYEMAETVYPRGKVVLTFI